MSEELVKKEDYDWGVLQELAVRDNSKGVESLPVIKIVYDSDSIHGMGSYVIGMEKDKNGKIINQRTKISTIVILKVKNIYAYFNEKTNINCYSPIHDDFEPVEGNYFHNRCGKSCPYKNSDNDPACKAQKVIYCVAITSTKEKIEAVMYVHGESYMPVVDYLKSNSIIEVEGKKYLLPYYAYLTNISTEKKKYQGRDYFVIKFEKSSMLKMDNIKKFADMALEVDNFIEKSNNSINNSKNKSNTPSTPTDIVTPVNNTVTPVNNTVTPVNNVIVEDTITNTSTTAVIVDDDDDLFKD